MDQDDIQQQIALLTTYRERLEILWAQLERLGTEKQINEYLKPKPLAGVRALLRDDPTLRELLDTPLMLSIVALAYKDTSPTKLRAAGTPEERRRQVFDDYIAAMFARPGRSKGSA